MQFSYPTYIRLLINIKRFMKHWTLIFLKSKTLLYLYTFFSLSNKSFQLAEATIDALMDVTKVVWLQSKFNDPMKTQLCLKSHTEEDTHVLSRFLPLKQRPFAEVHSRRALLRFFSKCESHLCALFYISYYKKKILN